MSENTVYLSTASYNSLYADNVKYKLLVSRLLKSASLSEYGSSLSFNPIAIDDLMLMIFPYQYKKRLEELKQQNEHDNVGGDENESRKNP